MNPTRYVTHVLITIIFALIASTACSTVAYRHDTASASSATPVASTATILPCEPLSFRDLAFDPCAGTAASGVTDDPQHGCVCHSDAYLAVSNGLGVTCVHRKVALARLASYLESLDQRGVQIPTFYPLGEEPDDAPATSEISWFRYNVETLLHMSDRLSRQSFERRLARIQRNAPKFVRETHTDKCVTIVTNASTADHLHT